MVLNTLHLFAGSGGGILADLLLGHRIVGAVEIDQYARQVLLHRQADGLLPQFPVWYDVRTFGIDNPDTAEYIKRLQRIRENLCISGGFPCQDISAAGKRAGIHGSKSILWKEFARIIGEIRPKYFFLENSNQLIRRGLDVVITDIASLGYSFAWGIISAGDVGAPHLRKRFWGVGISNSLRDGSRRDRRLQEMEKSSRENTNAKSNGLETAGQGSCVKTGFTRPPIVCDNISNADGARRETIDSKEYKGESPFRPDEICCEISDPNDKRIRGLLWNGKEGQEIEGFDGGRKAIVHSGQWREVESRLGGMADGISDWLDDCRNGTLWTPDEKGLARIAVDIPNRAARLKAIGNGQVPLCAAVAFTMLKEIVDNYDT